MSSTLAWVIGAALAVVVIWALIMGRRFLRGSLRFGNLSAELQGKQEARVSEVTAKGKDISVAATGTNSLVEKTRAQGSGINISASTTPNPVEKGSQDDSAGPKS